MTAPICSVHQKPMMTKGKGWFCATKLPDGSWCKEKAKEQPPAPTPAGGNGASAAPAANGGGGARLALAVAALEFAGRACDGEEHADPVAVAERAFDAMWARVNPMEAAEVR